MNEFVTTELEKLNQDFAGIVGRRFEHFFCPILYRDEQTELCKAHIINEAFRDSTRESTVQRVDVDSFYGSRFEADFVDMARFKNLSMTTILADPSLSRRFNATILHDDIPVAHFYTTRELPEQFSGLQLCDLDPSFTLGIKMQPSELIAAAGDHWEIEVSRDVRLPMLVSTIKSAHLSMFRMVGYQYALRAAGHFIGRSILGEFFIQNNDRRKKDLSDRALHFFFEFVHMVRPLTHINIDVQGTVTDRMLFLCMGGSGVAWAFIVFVKTGEQIHAVMIPTFHGPEQIETFLGFLKNDNSSIQVTTGRFEGDKWEVAKNTTSMNWPKDGLLLA